MIGTVGGTESPCLPFSPEQSEQREQYEQSEQREQPEQREQSEQREQYEQSEQREQYEQPEQRELIENHFASPVEAPEPLTLPLLGAGIAWLGALRHKMRRE